MLLNLKPRDVTCLTCRYDIKSSEPVPCCPGCGGKLLTVVYSALGSVRQPPVRVTPGPWETR